MTNTFDFPPGAPDTGIEPTSLISPSLAGGFFSSSATVLNAVMVIYKTSTEGFQVMVGMSLPSPQAGQGTWRDDGEYEQTPLGDNEGQGRLVCCSPWGQNESDTT